MTSQPIHIIGGGIAGLTLGRCLKGKGIPAIFFDKGDSPARHNYGISLQCWPPLLKLLNMDEDTFRSRLAVDSGNGGNGRICAEGNSKSGLKSSDSCFRAHCGRFESLLREGLDIRWKHTFEEMSHNGAENVLVFKEGEKIPSDFMVDTSGVHSRLRKDLSAESQLNVLPYVVFRGTRKVKRSIFEPFFKRTNVLESKRGGVVLQISINDIQKDTIDISYIYSRAAHSDDPLHTPGREKEGAKNITDEFYTEVSQLSAQYPDLESPFISVFDVEKMRHDRILHWLMRSSLVTMKNLNELCGKRITMIGDAAHAHPVLGGKGANQAVVDGVELAEWITQHGAAKVKDFNMKMYPLWHTAVGDSEKRLAAMHSKERSTL